MVEVVIHDPDSPTGIDWEHLRRHFNEDAIERAVKKLNMHRKAHNFSPISYAREQSGTPCMECGSLDLVRTGTCHVCCVCGASQGCS